MADNKYLSSDIYGTNDYVNAIKKEFMPDIPEDTLMLGIFGYMGQIFSDMIQNSIVMASELSNESIPTKAKFEKNIIAHALNLGINNINAVPAQMDVLLTFIENDISNYYNGKNLSNNDGSWEFIFDKDTPIYIGDHCFHVDYDIEIRKIKVYNSSNDENKFTYTARYLMDTDNPVSDITSPYLSAPVRMNMNGMDVIFTKCTLRQISKQTINRKVLSDNSIAAKTATFTFEGQLATFTVDVIEGDKITHLTPVYDGVVVENSKYPYVYYSYLDTNTIRIKFDKSSYMPRINSDVNINLMLTEGENGNFIYSPGTYPSFSFESEKYGYSAIGCEIRPITGESAFGINKKSISELKRLIPRESLSRGCITSVADLENYFNAIDTEDSVIHIYKKRDNVLERLYYMFILMKDAANNIIPTNTIDIKVDDAYLTSGTAGYIVNKNTRIVLNSGDEYGTVVPKNGISTADFTYSVPYNVVISINPLRAVYYMSVIDTSKFLEFANINENSQYQFIATSIKLYRPYMNSNNYHMTLNIEQSINNTDGLVYDGETVIGCNVRCVAVFYNNENSPIRWSEAEFVSYIPEANIFTFKFTLSIVDTIDMSNRIKVSSGIKDIGSDTVSEAYFDSNMKCVIHIMNKQDECYGNSVISGIVPDVSEYTVCNSYNVVDGVDFFYDYSDIINSTVLIDDSEDDNGPNMSSDDPSVVSEDGNTYAVLRFKRLIIKSVPVVLSSYLNTEDRIKAFCNEIIRRKAYIDHLSDMIEDLFGIDFKFFNTYGPSKLFTKTDGGTDYIDRVNINMAFRLKLSPAHNSNTVSDIIAYIKKYIEDINTIKSIHMSNLVSSVINEFKDHIEYFDYIGINRIAGTNDYDTSIRHIYASKMPDKLVVPEFLNIYSDNRGTEPIKIFIE